MLLSHWIWLAAAVLRNLSGLTRMLRSTQDSPPAFTERQSTITDWRMSMRASGVEPHTEEHQLASSATTTRSGGSAGGDSRASHAIPSWAADGAARHLHTRHSTIEDWRQGLANIFGASRRDSTERSSTVVVATSTR